MATDYEFLPLGSIVILKGALKKLLIVNRANIVEDRYFDYGSVLYPEGMVDENLAYFNHDDILKVVFEGFADEDDALMTEQLIEARDTWLAESVQEPETLVETVVETEEKASNDDDDPFAKVRGDGDE